MVPSNHVINGGVYTKLSYDPIKDFAPVSLLTKGYQLLVVNPQVKANNVAELIAAAKAALRGIQERWEAAGKVPRGDSGYSAKHIEVLEGLEEGDQVLEKPTQSVE